MRLEFRTERRGYTLILEQDLLGDFVLLRRWYGLHNKRGGFKKQVFFGEESARRELERITKLRARHGYRQHCEDVVRSTTPDFIVERKVGDV